MDLVRRVKANIYRHRMVERGCKVAVAVSGGPDSVVLLDVLFLLKEELGIMLHVVHLNHMFRGAESEEDALFVADMARRYGLPATVESADVPAYRDRYGLSAQVAARQVRYRFFSETAKLEGASKVALAHQADDQAETILINFLRGTGTTGLKGIPPVRDGFYIRPLLTLRRSEIERYCNVKNLPFRRDPSNLKPVYERNRVRMTLLPLLEEYNPALVPALLRLGEICREEDDYLDKQSAELLPGIIQETSPGRVVLAVEGLLKTPLAIRRRIVRRAWQLAAGRQKNLDFGHVEAVLALTEEPAAGPRTVLPGKVVAVKSYDSIKLLRKGDLIEIPYYIYPVRVPGETLIPESGCCISASLLSALPVDPRSLPSSEAVLDYNKLPPRIFVRRRREGDMFQPYGHVSGFKLKDFFIKQKIPREARDRVPLVCTPDEIVWVAGIRTGEKWKVTGETTRILHLKIYTKQE